MKLILGTVPVRQSPYRISQDNLKIVNGEIEYIVKHNVTETISGGRASPVS